MAELWQPSDENTLKRQRCHTTVFCQCFSRCGKYLAVGTNFGHIAVYNLPTVLSPDASENMWQPFVVFSGHNGPIYSLACTDRLLISSGTDNIQAWVWTDITAKNPKVTWSFTIPSTDVFTKPEVNSLAVCERKDDSTLLFAGCGDNRVHVWDIDSGKHLRSLEGHKDYIHSVVVWGGGNDCLSGSEDGTARIWDVRVAGEARSIIEPYKNSTCARPQFGKWVGCVAVDKAEDWVVCGGGPNLCMWHLRSLTPTTTFTTDSIHNTVLFQEDLLISAGEEPHVFHWSVNGDQRARVPCTPTIVYDVATNETTENTKVLSMAGNCNQVDICTNFGYKAFSLRVY